jgi:polysaccharide export outer membrane protein
MIRMPLIEDELRAACRTEAELSKEIATRYLEYLKDPQVDVFVKEFNSQPVSMVGAVAKPGRFQLQRRVRLLELITLGGGPADSAGRYIQIIHSDDAPLCDSNDPAKDTSQTSSRVVSINLSQMLQGVEVANPYLSPGDIISVPVVDQVFVVGNVYRPTNIPLREPITLSRAVALAGGVLEDSKNDKVRLIRQNAGQGSNTEIIVNLKAISRLGAPDVVLQAGDIVEVPVSGKSRFKRIVAYTFAPALALAPTSIIR